jgi:hypothetical protein
LGREILKKVNDNSDSRYCNDFVYSQDKKECFDYANESLAVKNLDKEMCSKLDPSIKERCVERIAAERAIKFDDMKECQGLESEVSQNECHRKFIIRKANSTLDKSYCLELKDSNERDMCLFEVKAGEELRKMEDEDKEKN